MNRESHSRQLRSIVFPYYRVKKNRLENKDEAKEKHTPRWAIKNEREEEAKNPGPPLTDCDTIDIETSNITSGDTNKETAFARKAAIQFLQEVGVNEGQRVDMAVKAIEATKTIHRRTYGPRVGKSSSRSGSAKQNRDLLVPSSQSHG